MESKFPLEKAESILQEYLISTGVKGDTGDPAKRYLWTDAFAVQSLIGLSHLRNEPLFQQHALHLIELVHQHLGSYHPDDERQGRISGLSPEEAALRPTMGGLRIGKDLPERKKDQSYNSQLEWERDGQYFHYLTRWISALLQAEKASQQVKYGEWAIDLMMAAAKFIHRDGDRLHMFWKMNTDLSYPLVPTTGAHDPLEGIICCKRLLDRFPHKTSHIVPLLRDFETLCRDRKWSTKDPLGIGGLLLNTSHILEVSLKSKDFIREVRPRTLLDQCLSSLSEFSESFNPDQPASQRLAFRECGLSLGLRVLYGRRNELSQPGLDFEGLSPFISLAYQLETFWSSKENQQDFAWKDHENINGITLAASLIAKEFPAGF